MTHPVTILVTRRSTRLQSTQVRSNFTKKVRDLGFLNYTGLQRSDCRVGRRCRQPIDVVMSPPASNVNNNNQSADAAADTGHLVQSSTSSTDFTPSDPYSIAGWTLSTNRPSNGQRYARQRVIINESV